MLEKHLNLSAKKKEVQLQEADNQVEQNRKHFYELSLEYVCKLQEIQERKKFECVEPVLSFFQGLFTFYHQGYELAKDFSHYKMALQINIQNVSCDGYLCLLKFVSKNFVLTRLSSRLVLCF